MVDVAPPAPLPPLPFSRARRDARYPTATSSALAPRRRHLLCATPRPAPARSSHTTSSTSAFCSAPQHVRSAPRTSRPVFTLTRPPPPARAIPYVSPSAPPSPPPPRDHAVRTPPLPPSQSTARPSTMSPTRSLRLPLRMQTPPTPRKSF
jgi:hypothetical protein